MLEAQPPSEPRCETLAETLGVGVDAGGKTLLDGVSFRLQPRNVTMIMGPNGAGKSTLLRVLHGLLSPNRGEVRWNSQPMNPAHREHQAMVFQRPVLLRRSAAANIDFALKLRRHHPSQAGDQSRDCRRDALLERVGLADKARLPARALSGGEQQRLVLARALALRPKVLFLDEPTTSLDPASTALIERIVMASHAEGTKVIFVTHNLGQARRLADEVVFLHRGRLCEHTAAESFFQNPGSAEARRYLEGGLIL